MSSFPPWDPAPGLCTAEGLGGAVRPFCLGGVRSPNGCPAAWRRCTGHGFTDDYWLRNVSSLSCQAPQRWSYASPSPRWLLSGTGHLYAGTSDITGMTAILSAEGVTPRVSTEVSSRFPHVAREASRSAFPDCPPHACLC